MNSFAWQGKDSYTDYGIIINVMPPETVPEENIDEIEIPGRDGNLTFDYGTKKSYTLQMTCTLLDFTKLNEIKAWLSGSGDLVFNWQSSYKYNARLSNKIDIAQALASFGEFPLIWRVQPYKKSITNALTTLTSSPATFSNAGTAPARSVIKVYGTGAIDLTINSAVIHLTNVVGYVTIDSDLMDCYKDTVLQNSNMVGNFPVLQVGTNNILWTGTVTKIEITPNLRFI